MSLKKFVPLLVIISIVSCRPKTKEIQFRSPNELGSILYASSDSAINGLTNESVYGKRGSSAQDTAMTTVNQLVDIEKSVTLAMWIKPEFTGRNGSILTLSKKAKDFPINSVLSIYLNKDRIAIMHNGNDVRKVDYDRNKAFTPYFMECKELKMGVAYFLTYIFYENTATVYIDGKIYAQYHSLPQLESAQFITFGHSWNEKGIKYKFDGYLRDVYIFEEALDSSEVNDLMDYTHLIQDGR